MTEEPATAPGDGAGFADGANHFFSQCSREYSPVRAGNAPGWSFSASLASASFSRARATKPVLPSAASAANWAAASASRAAVRASSAAAKRNASAARSCWRQWSHTTLPVVPATASTARPIGTTP